MIEKEVEPATKNSKEQIVATKGKFRSVHSILQIPVQQSQLKIRKLAKFSQQPAIDNEQIYSVDARNPLLKLRFEIDKVDGVNPSLKQNICISFRKLGLVEFFDKLQEIQDKLDLYT